MRIVKLKGMRQINGLHYAPDGRRLLAVGGYEVRSVDEARWVDVVGGTETLRVPLNAHSYAVSPNLSKIAVGNSRPYQDQRIAVVTFDPTDSDWLDQDFPWQAVDLAVEEPDSECEVHSLAFTPTGNRLAVSFSFLRRREDAWETSRHFRLVYLDRPREPEHVCHSGPITAVAFTPSGKHLASVGGCMNPSTIAVNSTTTQPHVVPQTFTPPTAQTRQLVFSPDSGTLAVANAKTVILLPPDLSAPRLTLVHPKQVNTVAFTPDGCRILTTCTDKLVRVWDANTGQLVTSYDWNVGVTNAIAVAPDGLTAAASGQSGRVVLFDLDG